MSVLSGLEETRAELEACKARIAELESELAALKDR